MIKSIKRFAKSHPILWEFITYGLVFFFGVLVSFALEVDDIQDSCNQHIVDNILTEEVQLCLLQKEGIDVNTEFVLPFNWST